MIIAITASYAWIFQNKTREYNLQTSNFIIETDVFFLQNDEQQISASSYKDTATGYYIVNISDPSALNYAGKLNINIRYKGVTKAYLRVYVGDMWLVNGEAINKENTEYITPTYWLENRIYDNYYYYSGYADENEQERGVVYCDAINDERIIPFISGIHNMAGIYNGELYLEIKAEAVQINRISSFWGMDSIPIN